MQDLFGFQLLDKAAATATAKDNDQGLSSVAAKVLNPVGGEGVPDLSRVSAKVSVIPGEGPPVSTVSAKVAVAPGGGEGAPGTPASPTLGSALR